jgi:hypothetical protein
MLLNTHRKVLKAATSKFSFEKILRSFRIDNELKGRQ